MEEGLRIMESGSSNDESGISSSGNDFWTNERHLDFLNLIETSFVRNVLEGHNKRSATKGHHHHRQNHRLATVGLIHHHSNNKKNNNLRLDRFVPDSCESTLDSYSTKTNYSGSVAVTNPVNRTRSRQRERSAPHSYKISHDQVVPQLDEKTSDKDEEEHNH